MYTPNFEYTDLGNAKRWASMFAVNFKKVPEVGAWFYWNDVRWVIDIHGALIKKTIDIFIESIADEEKIIRKEIESLETQIDVDGISELKKSKHAATDKGKYLEYLYDLLEANTKWQKACQSKAKIEACLSLACSMGASISYSEFDSKGKYLGVQNGVINLVTNEFVQNDPRYLITKSATALYNPEATCPNWEAFIHMIFEGDSDKISFIQRVAGEALLGERCKTKLIMFKGDGANGKSTFVDSLMLLLGSYAITTNPDAITSGNKSNDYYLASMKGARMAILNESRANAKLDNKMVKQLVDSGLVQARQIYGKPFEFQPVATPILTTNNPPIISSEYAINRRLLCVDFKYQIPEAQRDPNYIKNVLVPELSGMLNWALDGCQQYLQVGLNPPESILQSTREYIFEHDRVLKFVREEYEESVNSKVAVTDFYKDYLAWCQRFDFESYSSKHLNQELRGMGYRVKISSGNVYYVFGLAKKQIHNENVVAIDNRKAKQNALLDSLEFDTVST